jgi:hypothetical protein
MITRDPAERVRLGADREMPTNAERLEALLREHPYGCERRELSKALGGQQELECALITLSATVPVAVDEMGGMFIPEERERVIRGCRGEQRMGEGWRKGKLLTVYCGGL